MPWRTIEASSTTGRAVDRGAERRAASPDLAGRVAALGVAALLAVGAFVLAFGSGAAGEVSVAGGTPLDGLSSTGPGASAEPSGSGGGQVVVVEIVGAVTRPGVYRLPPGSRVGDLVDAAGGYSPRVDTDRATQALNRPRSCPMATRFASRPATTAEPATGAGGGGPGGDERRRSRRPEPGHDVRARRAARDRAGHGRQDHRRPGGGAVRDGRRPAHPQARRREDVRAAEAAGDGPLRCLAAAGSRSARSRPRGRSRSSARRWASPDWPSVAPCSWSRGGGRRGWPTRSGLVVLIGSALLLVRVAVGQPAAPPTDVVPDGRGPWTFEVEAVGAPRDGQQTATLRSLAEATPPIRVAATLPAYPEVVPGDRLTIEGPIRPRPDSPYGEYLERIGAIGTLTARSMTVERPPPDASHAIEAARQAAASALAAVLPEPEAGLAAGILVGLRDRVDRDLAAAFTTAGVSHVVAISGWNIAIVAAAIAAMAGRMRRRRRSVADDGRDRGVRRVRGCVGIGRARRGDGRRRAPGPRVRTSRTRGRGARLGRRAPADRRPGPHPRRRLPAVGARDGRPDRLGDAADGVDRPRRTGSPARLAGREPRGLARGAGRDAARRPGVVRAARDPVAGREPRRRAARRARDGGRPGRHARRVPRPRRRATARRQRPRVPGWVSLRIMVAIVDAMASLPVRERDAAGTARDRHGRRDPRGARRRARPVATARLDPIAGRRRRRSPDRAPERPSRSRERAVPAPDGSRSTTLAIAVVVGGCGRRQPARRRRAGDRARCRPGRRHPRRGLARRATPHRRRTGPGTAARRPRRADPAVGPADRRGDPDPPARGPRRGPRAAPGSLPGPAGLRAGHARAGSRLRRLAVATAPRPARRCASASRPATGSPSTTSTFGSCGRSEAGCPVKPPDGGTGINNVSIVLLGARRATSGSCWRATSRRRSTRRSWPSASRGSTSSRSPTTAAGRPRRRPSSTRSGRGSRSRRPGTGNPYGHPARATLERLSAAGARVFRTDRDGTVSVTFGSGRADGPGRRRAGRGRPGRTAPTADRRSLAFLCAIPITGLVPEREPAPPVDAGRGPAGRYARPSATIRPMTIPGRVDAASLLLSLDPPDWFVRHARAVAEVAAFLAARIEARGIAVDRRLVEAAACSTTSTRSCRRAIPRATSPTATARRTG